MRNRLHGVHVLAKVTAMTAVLLLMAGALVTSTRSGDSVPDWWFVPLSFGSLIPPRSPQVWIEHGHRLFASTIGILAIALAIGVTLRDGRSWVRRLSWAALSAVVVQGIIGGMRVKLTAVLSPAGVAIVHACFAQICFTLLVSLAVVTSPAWLRMETEGAPAPVPVRLPFLTVSAAALIFVQIILGAVFRHAGAGLVVHIGAALLIIVAVGAVIADILAHASGIRPLMWAAGCMGIALTAQVSVGILSLAHVAARTVRSTGAPASFLGGTTLHVAGGGLLLAGAVSAALWTCRMSPSCERKAACA